MVNEIHLNRYNNFIESRKLREIPEGIYTEKHHIQPRSLGGTNDPINLIILTAREHFIAHLILWKAYKGSMARAFHFMTNYHYKNRLTSRQYSELKYNSSVYMSKLLSGRVVSKEWTDKSNKTKKERGVQCWNKGLNLKEYYGEDQYQEVHKRYVDARTGIYHSEEAKQKLSNITKGKGNPFYGKKHTKETKEKQSIAKRGENHPNYGKNHSKETKNKMSKSRIGVNKNKTYDEIYGIKKAKEYKDKISNAFIDTIFINNDKIGKRIKSIELESYLSKGWKKGRLPTSKKKCPICGLFISPSNLQRHINTHN